MALQFHLLSQKPFIFIPSGFEQTDLNHIFALLGWYTPLIASFRHCGTAYQSPIQWSSTKTKHQKKKLVNISEERKPHLHSGGSLKSRTI
jgi:hypothetical protein